MNNADRQVLKEEITQRLKKNLIEILQKHEIKQQLTNKIVSEIIILSVLAIDNNL